jgi:hypothetical protein
MHGLVQFGSAASLSGYCSNQNCQRRLIKSSVRGGDKQTVSLQTRNSSLANCSWWGRGRGGDKQTQFVNCIVSTMPTAAMPKELVGRSNNKQGLSITRRMVDTDDQ